MAEVMEFTMETLQKMSKSNLEILAQSLHITIVGLSKADIIDKIVGTGQVSRTLPEATPAIDVSETKAEIEIKAAKAAMDISQTNTSDHDADVSYEDIKVTKSDLKLRLELMRVKADMREKKSLNTPKSSSQVQY